MSHNTNGLGLGADPPKTVRRNKALPLPALAPPPTKLERGVPGKGSGSRLTMMSKPGKVREGHPGSIHARKGRKARGR